MYFYAKIVKHFKDVKKRKKKHFLELYWSISKHENNDKNRIYNNRFSKNPETLQCIAEKFMKIQYGFFSVSQGTTNLSPIVRNFKRGTKRLN